MKPASELAHVRLYKRTFVARDYSAAQPGAYGRLQAFEHARRLAAEQILKHRDMLLPVYEELVLVEQVGRSRGWTADRFRWDKGEDFGSSGADGLWALSLKRLSLRLAEDQSRSC